MAVADPAAAATPTVGAAGVGAEGDGPLPDRMIRWAPVDKTGLEQLHFKVEPDRIVAESMVLGEKGGEPFAAHYRLLLDRRWMARELHVRLLGRAQGLHLFHDGKGYWRDESFTALPSLDGCFDLDLAATPFTASLPANRLALKPNEARDVKLVYVPFPRLTPVPLQMRWRRLDAGRRYRYQAVQLDFSCDLELDEDGIVCDFPDAFSRLV